MGKSARYEPGKSRRRTRTAASSVATQPAELTGRPPRYTVVWIHGIGPQEAPAKLKSLYETALFGRDLGERGRLVYWADILHPEAGVVAAFAARRWSAAPSERLDSGDDLLAEVVAQNPAAAKFCEALREKLRSDPPVVQDVAEVEDEYTQCFQAESAERSQVSELSPQFNAKILPTEALRRRITRLISEAFIPDVAAYLFDEEIRDQIRDRLRAVLTPRGGPYVIVSHSLGTVITYDVLCELEQTGASPPDIALWVTLGSPLGIEEVQDHLESPPHFPAGAQVQQWRNFSDRLDPVAFDATLADDFPGGDIADQLVINLHTPRLSGFNPHSALGYIGHPLVQKLVRDTVGNELASATLSFVMARDLAAELPGAPRRLPVLIQLDDALQGHELEQKRRAIDRRLKELTRDDPEAEIDPHLRRFVAANLTPAEVELLLDDVRVDQERKGQAPRELCIHRLWKNGTKKKLLDVSRHRVQVAPAALAYQATGKGIAWAVLDTGIRDDHPHFRNPDDAQQSLIAAQWNCCGPWELHERERRARDATDRDGHGSHVAGIIAGQQPPDGPGSDPSRELKSMAPHCRLHIYKVLKDDGSGTDSWIIKALDHIASVNEQSSDLVIHGVNLSLGGPFDADVFGCGHSPLCSELRRLWRMGVLVCVAAGNEGVVTVDAIGEGEREINVDLSIGDPANLDDAIAVGSVNKQFPHLYGVSYFSSRGPTADGRPKPDVVAPGEKIWSCNSNFNQRGEPLYVAMSGTSMACPHVSGLLAAFLSVRREFIGRPDEVKRLLMKHAIDLGRERYHQGAGMPNLLKMLAGT
jgi:subtilisin family serine protease